MPPFQIYRPYPVPAAGKDQDHQDSSSSKLEKKKESRSLAQKPQCEDAMVAEALGFRSNGEDALHRQPVRRLEVVVVWIDGKRLKSRGRVSRGGR
ncbi:hypothetical protein Tsubulata_008430 [Turnera subulata]|uniref:Uncharacterized protein n=1 Tax=Turnera subulata TaxID=218843 RepID=A0A9Q0FUV9_9ROSI|nr:hypothetical protein Tsubulata_008430 [Turnera subulata]